MQKNYKKYINTNETSLGIELGSTRIKSVLIGPQGQLISSGYHDWENQLIDNIWTYELEDVWAGIQASYGQLKKGVYDEYGITLNKIGSIGVSAMMHGYLAFSNEVQLVPFRTWRNSITEEAENKLTKLLNHNIPQRWSVAHFYQAVLNNEEHVESINYLTTLSGYVHWRLTGEKVIGVGDASGMFPIDSQTNYYHKDKLKIFNENLEELGFQLDLESLLPVVLSAGEKAGVLTEEGSRLLDISGDLVTGIPFAAPEGDAGTGMVATNSVKKNTGNISAGTSVFAMVVLEKPLSKVYPEIDIVVTPNGSQVAMVHVNNCTTEINAWVNIFKDYNTLTNNEMSTDELYMYLFETALNSDDGLEGIISYGYHSGENITNVSVGRPLLVRKPDANFTLSNLMRSILDSAFATLHIGLEILTKENVQIESMLAHGGVFKTDHVAQRIVSNAVGTPISLMKTANEGGAWGMALLANYLKYSDEMSLEQYLDNIIFNESVIETYIPKEDEIEEFNQYIKRYKKGLSIEQKAQEF